MKIKLKILFALSMALVGFAAIADHGSPAYEFLNVSPSSRVYGLGGHNLTIIDDDINLVEQNPALLGPEFDRQLGVGYMRYLGNSKFMNAAFGNGINDRSAWAVRVQYFGYGKMTAAEPDGTITGTFSPSDVAVTGVYSHDINERWRGGIAVKFISSSYESYSAFAICSDLGVNYFDDESDLSLSLVLKNLGGQVKKFNEEYNSVPWDIQMGVSKGLSSVPLRISVTATNLRRWKLPYMDREDKNSTTSALVEKSSFMGNLFRHLTFGVELLPSEKFYIGLGYDYRTRSDMATYSRNFLSGFSLAAGLKTSSLGFGLAFAQPHTGGTSFMLNLAVPLGELLKQLNSYAGYFTIYHLARGFGNRRTPYAQRPLGQGYDPICHRRSRTYHRNSHRRRHSP